MEDTRWLRLITVGLVLAALAVGYFLLSGRLFSNSTRIQSQVTKAVPSVTPAPSPSPVSAYTMIVERTQNQPQVLPKTGFPVGLLAAFAASAMIVGLGFRKYPY